MIGILRDCKASARAAGGSVAVVCPRVTIRQAISTREPEDRLALEASLSDALLRVTGARRR